MKIQEADCVELFVRPRKHQKCVIMQVPEKRHAGAPMRVKRNSHGPRRPWGARLSPKASSTPARFRQKVPRPSPVRAKIGHRETSIGPDARMFVFRSGATIEGLGRIVDLFLGRARPRRTIGGHQGPAAR